MEPLDSALVADGAKNVAINFAFDIFAVPADNKTGYSYTAVNLAPAARADPFAEVMAAIAGKDLPKLDKPAAPAK